MKDNREPSTREKHARLDDYRGINLTLIPPFQIKQMKASNVFRAIRERGLMGTLHEAALRAAMFLDDSRIARFDKRHGTDTGGTIDWVDLRAIDSVDTKSIGYRATPQWLLKRILCSLLQDIKQNINNYCFIDYGFGKGAVLLFASEFSFKRIIGIEISTTLHNIALKNISNYKDKKQKCKDVTCLIMNAMDFEPPHTHSFASFSTRSTPIFWPLFWQR